MKDRINGLEPIRHMAANNDDLPEMHYAREMYVTDDFQSDDFKLMLVIGTHDGKFIATEKNESWGGLNKSKVFTLYRFAVDKEVYENFQ